MKSKMADRENKKPELLSVQQTGVPPVSVAWPPFSQKLASVLETLMEDEILILSPKRSSLFIQFVGQGSYGIRSETTSNHYRSDAQQLSKPEIDALTDIGWHSPSSHDNDPDGSSNFYVDALRPLQSAELAEVAIRTFVEILQISHPGFLEYDAFDDNGNSIPLEVLGLKRVINAGEGGHDEAVPQQLLQAVKEITGIDDLSFNAKGDLGGIKYGSATTYINCCEDSPYIRMYSVLCRDVDLSYPLLTRINELNSEYGHMHLMIADGQLKVMSDVLVTPFVSSHITHALINFCQIADQFNSILKAEFSEEAVLAKQMHKQIVH